MLNIYEAESLNKRKSVFILATFFVFVFLVVYVISRALSYSSGYETGEVGMIGLAFIISGLSSLGGYYFSDKIVLTISGARPADRKKDFNFYTVSENLALASGLSRPKLYVIDDSAPNAFATGRDPKHAAICVTSGLLAKLNRSELEGVIAHELSHVKNYDTRLMSIVSVLVGMVALLADWFLRLGFRGRRKDKEEDGMGVVIFILGAIFAVLSPIIAQLIQLAISRRREFTADTGSVSITRQPQGLISALEKISQDPEPLEVANKATAHLYIINPFKSKDHKTVDWFSNLFNTHPPIHERIRSLKKMS
jgi:heat shock protein HtpX